jgi:polysaccharide export outer membrane protein
MRVIIYFLLCILLFSSCGTSKRFTYLQTQYPERDSFYVKKLTPYLLQPSDILYIKVSSALDKASQEFFNSDNSGMQTSMSSAQGSGLFLMGYSIDAEGNVNLPVMGKIMLAGSTVAEAKAKVQQMAEKYSSDARAEVKLLSFKVSIIGEVKSPGLYNIYNNNATLLEALALAGDLTMGGKRKNILILRAFKDGTKTLKVDLTKRDLLSSEKYYVQPNDIIYVEPLRSAAFRARVGDYTIILSIISTAVTTSLLIIKAFD